MVLIISGSNIISGAEFVLKDYIKNSALKNKMILLTTDINESKKLYDSLRLKKIHYSKWLGQTGVIKTKKLSSIIKKIYQFTRIRKLIKKLIDRENITTVVGNNSGDIIYSYHINNIEPDLKYILFVHDIIKKKTLMSLIFRFLNKYVDKYITVSNAVKNALIEIGIDNQKIEVVYNGLHYKKTIKTWQANKNTISFGYIGNIEKRKSPLSFIEFINKINQLPYFNYKAFIIFKHYDDNYLLQIIKLINKNKLRVKLLGEIERDKIDSFFETIDFLMVPSYEDPFPTVILEAFKNGVPVIGRDSGGIPEMISHDKNGFLFNDDSEFLNIINNIRNLNTFDYKSLSENANKTIKEKFNIYYKCNNIDSLLYDYNSNVKNSD